MQQRKQHTAFAVDGYAITASFADCKNAAALHHVKQILLSSFANNTAKNSSGDILAIPVSYTHLIVFTLIAWGAGLLLDANIHFGDPQGFLGLRVLLPVLAMGLCLLRAMKEDKRNGDK